MEDRQKNTPSQKEACGLGGRGGIWPFVIGLVAALAFGWWVFPEIMFSKQDQPVRFSHETHLKDASLDCGVCHYLRADGTFSGIPTTADCAVCHSQLLGASQAERVYESDYVRAGKEVRWLVYQKQPDNVYFSHAAHSLESCNTCHQFSERELCGHCHLDVGGMKTPPVFAENRLSGYSRETMKMWKCEACHANPNHLGSTDASNACFVCHK